MQSPAPKETLETLRLGLAEVLHALDDETLQRIFKVAQPLTVNDLQYEDGAAVEPSWLKGGDLRRLRLKREDTADMPLQMKVKNSQRSNERVDTSAKDLSII